MKNLKALKAMKFKAGPQQRRWMDWQPADLEDHQRAAEIEHRQLHVRGLALVAEIGRIDVPAADRHGAEGLGDFGQDPAGDIHLVHSLVADIAVAGVPEPVPEVREPLLVERPHRRRSEEQVPVQAGGLRAVRRVSDRRAQLVAQRFRRIS